MKVYDLWSRELAPVLVLEGGAVEPGQTPLPKRDRFVTEV